MKQLRNFLVKSLEIFLILAFSVLVLDVLWGVFSRYVMGHQSQWTEQLAVNLIIWVSLLGATLTYEEKGHLGVDYFVGKLHPDAQRIAAAFVEIVVLIFAAYGLCYGGWYLVSATLQDGQVNQMLWDIKVGYIYSVVPISGVFFILFGLEHLWEIVSGKTVAIHPDKLEGVE